MLSVQKSLGHQFIAGLDDKGKIDLAQMYLGANKSTWMHNKVLERHTNVLENQDLLAIYKINPLLFLLHPPYELS